MTQYLLVVKKADPSRCEWCVAVTPSPYSDAIICRALNKILAANIALKDVVTPDWCPLLPYDHFKQK